MQELLLRLRRERSGLVQTEVRLFPTTPANARKLPSWPRFHRLRRPNSRFYPVFTTAASPTIEGRWDEYVWIELLHALLHPFTYIHTYPGRPSTSYASRRCWRARMTGTGASPRERRCCTTTTYGEEARCPQRTRSWLSSVSTRGRPSTTSAPTIPFMWCSPLRLLPRNLPMVTWPP